MHEGLKMLNDDDKSLVRGTDLIVSAMSGYLFFYWMKEH